MWSGTDYLKNTSSFWNNGLIYSSSKDYSYTGDYSLEVIEDVIEYRHVIFYDAVLDGVLQGMVNVINNNEYSCYLRIVEMESNQFTDINIPPNESWCQITISRQITYRQNIRFLLITRNPATIYVDEISLTLQ